MSLPAFPEKKKRKESWLGKQKDFSHTKNTKKGHVNYEAGKYYFMKGFVGWAQKNILHFSCAKESRQIRETLVGIVFFFLALAAVSKLRRGRRRKRI